MIIYRKSLYLYFSYVFTVYIFKEAVGGDESAPLGIVVTALQIVIAGFRIVVITSVTQRVCFGYLFFFLCAVTGQRFDWLAPFVIGVLYEHFALRIRYSHNIAELICYVEILHAFIYEAQRGSARSALEKESVYRILQNVTILNLNDMFLLTSSKQDEVFMLFQQISQKRAEYSGGYSPLYIIKLSRVSEKEFSKGCSAKIIHLHSLGIAIILRLVNIKYTKAISLIPKYEIS